MRICFTRIFQKDYRALPRKIRKKTKEQVARIQVGDFSHPSLRLKKMRGKEIWEATITMDYRLTFQIEGDLVTFRVIGTHDILEK